jgi:cellulose biosynthesis protein BcsS
MVCSWRVHAAASAAAAIIVCCVCVLGVPAWAGDDEDATVILFSGRDLWRNGAFAYGGLLVAPGGFAEDGPMLKLVMSGGLYRYDARGLGGDEVTGSEIAGQILPGWRIKRGGVEAKIFFGLDIERHNLSPDDPDNKLRGSDVGARFAAELWYEPTERTMIAGDLSLSTVATNNTARLAYGWHVLEDLLGGFYVGPETQYVASDGYRHVRLGAHITGLKGEAYEWSAAAGWAGDSDRRTSAYVRLGVAVRQ